jgi:hypothetical protein
MRAIHWLSLRTVPPVIPLRRGRIAARKGCRHISQDARGEQGDSDSSGSSSARYRCIHLAPHPCLPSRHTQHSNKMGTAAGRLRQDKAGVGERWRETPLAAKCPAAAVPPCPPRQLLLSQRSTCGYQQTLLEGHTARAQPPEGIGGQREGYSRQQRGASQWPGCCCCCSGARQKGRGAVAHSTWGVRVYPDGESSEVAAPGARTSGTSPSG